MMQSRSREKAMLATVSRLRRLLRKADLATKRVRVMGSKIFYIAGKVAGGELGVPLGLPPSEVTRSRCDPPKSGESFPQLAAQYLARRRPRDHFHKVNLAGLLVVGEAVGDEVAQFLFQRIRGRKAFTED